MTCTHEHCEYRPDGKGHTDVVCIDCGKVLSPGSKEVSK